MLGLERQEELLRIISGRFKGRNLVSFKAPHIRPTTDRVKESLFNKIQGQVQGAKVLDLFAGTGSLGLEAISRGAEHVHFVDDSPLSLKILRKNLSHLGLEEGFHIQRSDVSRFLKSYQGEPFDLVLIDPPFTKLMSDEVLLVLSQSEAVWHSETLVATETARGEKVQQSYGNLIEFDQKDYGDKALRWFCHRLEKK